MPQRVVATNKEFIGGTYLQSHASLHASSLAGNGLRLPAQGNHGHGPSDLWRQPESRAHSKVGGAMILDLDRAWNPFRRQSHNKS